MKKTSTRLATIGGVIVLGAFAIALAQHDSRKRGRENPASKSTAQAPPKPIAVDSLDGSPAITGEEDPDSPGPIVRGNNDHLTSYAPVAPEITASSYGATQGSSTDANPLRESSMPALDDTAVVTASGQQESSGLPSTTPRPAWATDAAMPHNATAPLPSMPTGGLSSDSNERALPGLPSIPPTTTDASQSAGATVSDQGISGTLPPGGDSNISSPALPSVVQSGTPDPLPRFPLNVPLKSAPPNALPSSLPAGQQLGSGNYPATQNAQSSIASRPQGSAQSPTNAQSDQSASQRPPAMQPRPPVSDLSDTQRGAMQPTDLSQDYRQSISSPPIQSPTPPSIARPRNGYSGNNIGTLPSTPAQRLGPPSTPRASQVGTQAQHGGSYPNANGGGASLPGNSSVQSGSGAPGSMRINASLVGLVSDEPGNRYLDGSQSPNPQIEKRAPEEIQVGKKATFVIVVNNVGNASAHDVTVVDKVPRGAVFSGSEPQVRPAADGLLTWKLGEIPAGESRTIRMDIIPKVEGEMGSTASVHFAAQASVRTLATLPKLKLTLESLPDVLIGSQQQVIVNIENVGTGVARNVELAVDVPDQLQHGGGRAIGATVGDLYPGQSRRITNLAFGAVQPGKAQCVFRAVTPDGLEVSETLQVDVKSPQLVSSISGPKRRHLERQATYTFTVINQGTATATNLDFAVHLPSGLKYVSSDVPAATYDQSTHVVHVGLAELPAGQPAPFEVTVLPVAEGNQGFSLKGSADLNLTTEATGQVIVEGFADLDFTVDQDNGSIEAGATTTYSVLVHNVGNKSDRNVQLSIQLPPNSKIVNVSPNVQLKATGETVTFAPIAELPVRQQRTFQFEVQHMQVGTRIVKVMLMSENLAVRVIKEQHTFVYDDSQ